MSRATAASLILRGRASRVAKDGVFADKAHPGDLRFGERGDDSFAGKDPARSARAEFDIQPTLRPLTVCFGADLHVRPGAFPGQRAWPLTPAWNISNTRPAHGVDQTRPSLI
jgi:hypothetical protein